MKKAIVFLGLSVLLFSNSALAQNLPSYLPSNGLVGWWPFNGNANDESGNGNHGTVNGATMTTDRFGNSGSAYDFDGLDDFISSSPYLPIGNESRTVSVWINVDNFVTDAGIVGWGAFNLLSYSALGISPEIGKLFFWTYDNDLTSTNVISAQQWTHFLVSYHSQSNLAQLFINGNNVGIATLQNLNTISSELLIGKSLQNGSTFFSGIIDDISIYNRALTQEEITALYTGTPINGGGGSSSANPVPPGIPYQAVVRNANGQVAANAAVTTRFTLHQTTADGAVEYQETHALTTNAQGLMATALGQGTAVQNTFAAINWANTTKFLQVEVDLGNGYVDLGTQQLMSVPFAQRAAAAGTIENGTLPIFADNAAALAGGLSVGKLYRTSTGDLKIVY
jgi:hypothetical protein